ncbi:ATP-grasp domain-containing protein [Parendozoicomonas sp. Alg238-R29]|uniref:ATP-grasp domain-containing protein n=1 Tax=Parendozoicomonas sp. Alg238-R29 TaxID=2993446 RepID=UPI00248F285A|nr:ATP-grasp domain-containing protein [Parendozoicomonas sp. Alg238-R29]
MIGNRDENLIEQAIKPTFGAKQAHVGMPPLPRKGRALAFFEFWPTFLVYLPVVFLWLFQTIRYRGLTVPLCANPGFYLGGLVGESKADNFLQAGDYAKKFIAPWFHLTNRKNDLVDLLSDAKKKMQQYGLEFPIIAKPDMGCRGEGVRIVRNDEQLEEYFRIFPDNAVVILQELIPWEPEAGVFYIRKPGETRGKIFSLTLKYQPYVYGNGVDTLRTLIQRDRRAGKLSHLYIKRHSEQLDDVLEPGQPFRLAFAGSHSRGAIFRDGRDLITERLTSAFDHVSKDINGFYFGRFDVRFANERSLLNGEDFRIVEVNGISSEAAHIWDSESSLREVYKTLFTQYNTLFEIGAINRDRGHKPGALRQVVSGFLKETKLGRQYPDTE